MKYITKQGDTFDEIAYKIYGDCRRTREIMAANWKYLDVYKFDEGTVLEIPEITSVDEFSDQLPNWR